MEGERLRLVARPRLGGVGVDVVLAGTAAVGGRVAVVGDRRVLLLVRRHHDDLARGLRQPAEPFADGAVGAIERRPRGRLDLLARIEVQRRVLAQCAKGRGEPIGPEQTGAELDELAVDPGDLLQADRMHVLGNDVERGVGAGQQPVCLAAAGDVRQPGQRIRARSLCDLVHDDGPVPLEGGPDLLTDDVHEPIADLRRLPRGIGQWPLGVRLGQQLVELLDDLGAQHRYGGAALGGAASQVGHGLVEVPRHVAPALEERIGLGRGANRLVGGDVQELDLRPVHRVDIEGHDVGVEEGAVDAQRVGQGGTRGRVAVLADRRQLALEAVEERTPGVVGVGRVVLQPIVEAAVAEGRREGRVAADVRLPVGVGESVERGGCGGGGHAAMLAPARVTG